MKSVLLIFGSLGLLLFYWIGVQYSNAIYMLELSDAAGVVLPLMILPAYVPTVYRVTKYSLCDQASRLIVGVFYFTIGSLIVNTWRLVDRITWNNIVVSPRDDVLGYGLALCAIGLFLCLIASDTIENTSRLKLWGAIAITLSLALGGLSIYLTILFRG